MCRNTQRKKHAYSRSFVFKSGLRATSSPDVGRVTKERTGVGRALAPGHAAVLLRRLCGPGAGPKRDIGIVGRETMGAGCIENIRAIGSGARPTGGIF